MLTFQNVNLGKLSSSAPWATSRTTLLLVFLLSCLVPAGPRSPIATAVLDPILNTPAQDEALYSHGILRMAAGQDLLTPRFLGRPLLVKPPLLQWLSTLSVHCFGPRLWALRLPSILAAAATLTLVYWATGPVGWLLLASTTLWRARAGLVLMDDLLTLWYLLAVLLLLKQPKLTARWAASALGLLIGLAIMTKWFAGILPVALLLWTRPSLRKCLEAASVAALIALPWHLYQFQVNHDWFLAEYLGVELLGYAFRAPVQASGDSWFAYYLPRLAWLLPLALPLLRRQWNPTALAWIATLLASIAAYSYRNTTYLAPLAPALLLCHRGWIPWTFAPLALAGLLAWPPPQPQLPLSTRFEGREVLHLDPDDQLRTSLQPGATVRYIFLTDHLPPNGPLDFEKLGIAATVESFLADPAAKVDAILARDLAQLKRLIAESPQRDFILPLKVWQMLNFEPPHEVILESKVILRSRQPQPGPRPNAFPLLKQSD